MSDDTPELSPSEAAELLGLHERDMRTLCRTGVLRPRRLPPGRKYWLIRAADVTALREFIAARKAA